MRPIGCKDRLSHLKMFFVECPVCVICSSQGRADMKDQGWKG